MKNKDNIIKQILFNVEDSGDISSKCKEKIQKLQETQLTKCLDFINKNYQYEKISWTKLSVFIDFHCRITTEEMIELLEKKRKYKCKV